MIRPLMTLSAAFTLLALTTAPVLAAPCKDAKGRFTKCPEAPKAGAKCRNVKGHFAKCGTPGAKPV